MTNEFKSIYVDLTQYVDVDHNNLGKFIPSNSNGYNLSFFIDSISSSGASNFNFWSKFQWIAFYNSIEEIRWIHRIGDIESFINFETIITSAFHFYSTKFPLNYWFVVCDGQDRRYFPQLNEMEKSYVIFLKKAKDFYKL